jgi:hypothetical protein
MPAISYHRVDHVVTVTTAPPKRAGGRERVAIEAPNGGTWTTWVHPDAKVMLRGLQKALPPLPPEDHRDDDWYRRRTIDRVVLALPAMLAAAPWEDALAEWATGRVIVRACAAAPPYIARPLALPLRIGVVAIQRAGEPGDGRAGRSLGAFIDRVTRSARREFAVHAVENLSSVSSRLDANMRRRRWPTLDVMQLDGRLPITDLLDPEPSGPPGSLGWIERAAALYQVRLVVLPISDESAVVEARRLAARLVDRGGPAVLLATADQRTRPGSYHEPGLRQIYAGLIHDEPLDVAMRNVPGAGLFAGAGREDALRVSAGADRVVARASTDSASLDDLISEFRSRMPRPAPRVRARRLMQIRSGVKNLVQDWPGIDFSGEGRGLYPTAQVTEPITDLLAPPPDRVGQPSSRPGPTSDHFVNATLLLTDTDGRPAVEAAVDGPPLISNATYLLRVDVGPLAEHVRPAGALELLVENQLWDPVDNGLWTELGVTGVGCTVLGSAVQPLWVPRHGPSAPRYVAVRIGQPGIAMLRYTLYHRTHVVQSFRLAAVVARSRRSLVSTTQRRGLAAVLGLTESEVGERTWYSRLEFSTVARIDQADTLPARTLALVVNDMAGTPVITVKGRDTFEVNVPSDFADDVQAVRKALNEVSGADQNAYRFGGLADNDPNSTDDAFYSFALGRLAQEGWSLRDRLLPADGRDAIDALLAVPGATIQVAHIVRDKVVPWALLYDKPYDANRRKLQGRQVDHIACTASLPHTDGTLGTTTCRTDPACPLHPDRLAERDAAGSHAITPETVACPLGFWGIRHHIEIPPRQVVPGRAPAPPALTIDVEAGARVMLGFNSQLASTPAHRAALETAIATARRGGIPAMAVTDRDDVVDALAEADLDIVYLYCHAVGGDPGPVPPRLEFQDATDPKPVPITPAELPLVSWTHHPLVVLNGCGTTGFSTHGTSQFIAALVDLRQAGAVIGADVPVAEPLAAEVGATLVRAVLDGASIGQALAQARRALLSRRNPLGLVYTLYGSVELKFRPE